MSASDAHATVKRTLIPALVLAAACRAGSTAPPHAAASGPRVTSNWDLPRRDPCGILSATEVGALLGAPIARTGPGGSAMDGTACQYVGADPFVVTLAMISTNAYESLFPDMGGQPVAGLGTSAQLLGPDGLGDVTIIARTPAAAVLVRVSGLVPGMTPSARSRLVAEVARNALARLP